VRLLIVSTGAGTGHNRAAAALEEAARATQPDAVVSTIDALDYGTSLLRDIYARSYILMANRIPALWGFVYTRSNDKDADSRLGRLRALIDRVNARRLLETARAFRPDAILCTHFLPASVLGNLAEERRIPLSMVVTDFDLHAMWVQPRVAHYFVAAEGVRRMVIARGIPGDRISVAGIPILDRFRNAPSRAEARRRLGFDDDRPLLLAMGGGFGRRGLAAVVEAAASVNEGGTVLAVTGRNRKVRAAIERLHGGNGRVKTYGFVENVEVLMSASNLLLSKPGGLTSAESLTMGLPMVLTSPVPGQEEQNAAFLVASGAAVRTGSTDDLRRAVGPLLGDRDRLESMARAALDAARPFASRDIVRRVLDDAQAPRAKLAGLDGADG